MQEKEKSSSEWTLEWTIESTPESVFSVSFLDLHLLQEMQVPMLTC